MMDNGIANEVLFCMCSMGLACLFTQLHWLLPLFSRAVAKIGTALHWLINMRISVWTISIISALLEPVRYTWNRLFPQDEPYPTPQPVELPPYRPARRAWELYEDYREELQAQRRRDAHHATKLAAEQRQEAGRQERADALSCSLNRFIHGSNEAACQKYVRERRDEEAEQEKNRREANAKRLEPRETTTPSLPSTPTPYSHQAYTSALANLQSSLGSYSSSLCSPALAGVHASFNHNGTSPYSPRQSSIDTELIERLPAWMKASPHTVAYSVGRFGDNGGLLVQIPGLPSMQLDLRRQVYVPVYGPGGFMGSVNEETATRLARAKLMSA